MGVVSVNKKIIDGTPKNIRQEKAIGALFEIVKIIYLRRRGQLQNKAGNHKKQRDGKTNQLICDKQQPMTGKIVGIEVEVLGSGMDGHYSDDSQHP